MEEFKSLVSEFLNKINNFSKTNMFGIDDDIGENISDILSNIDAPGWKFIESNSNLNCEHIKIEFHNENIRTSIFRFFDTNNPDNEVFVKLEAEYSSYDGFYFRKFYFVKPREVKTVIYEKL